MPKSLIARLTERIVITEGEDPCWLWQGADSGNGYGRISVRGKTRAVHIVIYEIVTGFIPDGMVLDHLCRNRNCCNPKHLQPKTILHNTLIGEGPTAKNARKKKCKRGHPLEGDNLMLRERNGRTHRECRACRLLRSRNKNGSRATRQGNRAISTDSP